MGSRIHEWICLTGKWLCLRFWSFYFAFEGLIRTSTVLGSTFQTPKLTFSKNLVGGLLLLGNYGWRGRKRRMGQPLWVFPHCAWICRRTWQRLEVFLNIFCEWMILNIFFVNGWFQISFLWMDDITETFPGSPMLRTTMAAAPFLFRKLFTLLILSDGCDKKKIHSYNCDKQQKILLDDCDKQQQKYFQTIVTNNKSTFTW